MDDTCASCKRPLNGIPACNAELDRFAPYTYRPYFCSEECAEKAAGIPRIRTEIDAHARMLEGWVQDAMEDSAGAETLSDTYHYHKRNLRDFETDRPRLFQEKSDAAYGDYFQIYSNAAFAKRQAELDKQVAAAEKAVARDREKADAAVAKQSEADRKAAEKKAEVDRKAREEEKRLRPILFEMPSDHSRYEGVHVLGPAGSGKTTLLQEFIIHDVLRDVPPSLIVIDPKGTLIQRLKQFAAIDPRKIVVIDAANNPPKLGLFAKSANPAVNSEQVINQAVATYKYIFEAANFSFTPKQGILFEYLVRLMFDTGGTLTTLSDFLRDYPRRNNYEAALTATSDDVRDFFLHDYKDSYDSTGKEIAVRLQQIKQKPILRKIFDTTERDVDIFECIQSGKMVLVNSGMSLDPDTSRMIGRFVIAMALNAVYVRSQMPKSEWYPTFMMIDEFQEFVDAAKTPELLRFPREYNFGTMILHHNMYAAELDDAIRVAISTNTGIKYCADPRGKDLRYMMQDLNTDADFLRRQQTDGTYAHFAHTMRRKHETAVSVMVPLGNLDDLPKREWVEPEPTETRYVSESEWADHHNSGHIDDAGRDGNIVYKIDPNMQRWHVGAVPAITTPTPTVTTPSSTPTLKPTPPAGGRPEDW